MSPNRGYFFALSTNILYIESVRFERISCADVPSLREPSQLFGSHTGKVTTTIVTSHRNSLRSVRPPRTFIHTLHRECHQTPKTSTLVSQSSKRYSEAPLQGKATLNSSRAVRDSESSIKSMLSHWQCA